MSSFTVATQALTGAALVVANSDSEVDASGSSLQGDAGALDGTPAMTAYALFLGAASTALEGQREAAGDLSRSLNTAAFAYQTADASAASSLRVSG